VEWTKRKRERESVKGGNEKKENNKKLFVV
jgi:hypothetical protein